MGCDYYENRILRVTHAGGVAYHPEEISSEKIYSFSFSSGCTYSVNVLRNSSRDRICMCGQKEDDAAPFDPSCAVYRAQSLRHDLYFVRERHDDEENAEPVYENGAFSSEKKYENMIDELVLWGADEVAGWNGEDRSAKNAKHQCMPVSVGERPLTDKADVEKVDIILYRVIR